MDKIDFRDYLKRLRRKPTAIEQIVGFLDQFELYFQRTYVDRGIRQITPEVLESYASWIESEPGESASKPLWALRYYFDFIENQGLSDLAGDLRAERIKRKPFGIRNFRGVNADHVARFEGLYIENSDQMLDAGRTPRLRNELAAQTGIPLEGILEMVKLCDLARLKAVRSVRARLYYDAGLTPEIIATWESEDLRPMLVAWVAETGFEGIAPLPREVDHLVREARSLPLLVVY